MEYEPRNVWILSALHRDAFEIYISHDTFCQALAEYEDEFGEQKWVTMASSPRRQHREPSPMRDMPPAPQVSVKKQRHPLNVSSIQMAAREKALDTSTDRLLRQIEQATW